MYESGIVQVRDSNVAGGLWASLWRGEKGNRGVDFGA